MAYVKRMVCLANSFKIGGSCIAGKEILPDGCGDWIRPVSARESAEVRYSEFKYADNTTPKLLDIIDIPLLNPAPHNHQIENHVIDTARTWARVDMFPRGSLPEICDQPPSLWINGTNTRSGGVNNCILAASAETLEGSLVLIHPENFVVAVGSKTWDGKTTKTYWGNFIYNRTRYSLKVTDPAVTNFYQHRDAGEYPLDDVYICVSLTEAFTGDGNCHKLVAAVFTEQPLS